MLQNDGLYVLTQSHHVRKLIITPTAITIFVCPVIVQADVARQLFCNAG